MSVGRNAAQQLEPAVQRASLHNAEDKRLFPQSFSMPTTLTKPSADSRATHDETDLPWDDVDVTSDEDVALDTLTPVVPTSGLPAAASLGNV